MKWTDLCKRVFLNNELMKFTSGADVVKPDEMDRFVQEGVFEQ